MVLASVLAGTATVGMGLTSNVWFGATFVGSVALSIAVFNVLIMSLRQALIPGHMFGRVQGAYRTLVWGLIPIGALLGGVVARLTSVPITFLISGALQVILGALLWRLLSRHRTQIEAAHQTEPISVG